MNAGDVIFNFKGDTSDIEKTSSNVGSKIKSVAKGFLGVTATLSTAMVGVVSKSVQMAGDLEQQIGGTEAVFGEFASTVQDYSQKAFETAGMSANDYMATINKMGALMQGSGISQEQSLDLSAKAMQRAADVASIMGIDVESAMQAIAGAAKGNFTMMDNLGVAMNATSLQAYALSKGINESYNSMDNATKVQLAMEMFLEKSAYATGNYAKENETFAGSLNTMQASIKNLMAGTGTVDDVIKSVSRFGKVLVKNIGEIAPKVINGVVELVNGIIPLIPELLQTLLPVVINGAIMLIQGLIDALPMLLTMLAQMLPTIIQQLITGLITCITALLENIDLIIDAGIELVMGLIEGLIDAIPIIIDNLPKIIDGIIKGLANGLPKIFSMGPKLIVSLIKGLLSAIPSILKAIPQIIVSLIKGFMQGVGEMFKVGIEMVKGLWEGIKNVTGWVIDKIKGFGKSIVNGIKGIFGIHSPSTEFEFIGKMNVKGLEKGMEDEKAKLQDTFDSMFDLSPSLYGSSSLNLSPNVNVYVENNMSQDPLGQFVNDVKTFSGGSKNDYSYGMGA